MVVMGETLVTGMETMAVEVVVEVEAAMTTTTEMAHPPDQVTNSLHVKRNI